jgi:hypothetical protein
MGISRSNHQARRGLLRAASILTSPGTVLQTSDLKAVAPKRAGSKDSPHLSPLHLGLYISLLPVSPPPRVLSLALSPARQAAGADRASRGGTPARRWAGKHAPSARLGLWLLIRPMCAIGSMPDANRELSHRAAVS